MEAILRLHDLVVKFVARHELCRRFMPIRGVGPVTALSFVTAIDDPSRFRRSRDVAACFGLTSRRRQSGTSIDVQRRISKAGDGDVRRALYEAASALMTPGKAQLPPQGDGGRGAQAGGDHARHVDGRNLLRRRCGGQRQRTPSTRRHEGWQAAGSPGMSGRTTSSMLRSVIPTAAD